MVNKVKCKNCGEMVEIPEDCKLISCNPNKEPLRIYPNIYDSINNHGFVRVSEKPMHEGDVMGGQTGVIGKV